MELLQLKYFCDAAKTENFSRTAAKFFVPPSNISQTVKRLEAELGCELFEHNTNKVRLTEVGRAFYERAAEALLLLDEAKDAVCNGEAIRGDIKLTILANRRTVTEAIEKFKAEHPNVSFIIKHENDGEPDCDILISDTCPVGYFEHGVLVREDIVLAMKSDHPLAAKADIQIRDLSGESFISMPRGRSIHTITEEICKSAGFVPDITIQTDDPYYIRKYVELGLGVSFFPSVSWEGLFSENAVIKKIGDHKRKTSLYLPKSKKTKPAVEAFIKVLLDRRE